MNLYTVILYYTDRTRVYRIEAECYADAVNSVAPGMDVIKVEVIVS